MRSPLSTGDATTTETDSDTATTGTATTGTAPDGTGRGPEGHTERDPGDRYPWIAMGVVLIGTFMVVLDTTIVNVALPQIGIALGRSSGIEWVVTAYMLAVGLGQPATGWLADRFGRKQVFVTSLGLFTAGSLLAALSPNLETLVAFRVLQGLGGGFMMPVGMTMIYELFPPDRRGTALGIWGIAAMTAPALGPVIGGYLATTVSWHWLFLVNVPIGALGVLAGVRLLRDTGYRERRPFDALGLTLASSGLVAWLLGFSGVTEHGWSSPRVSGTILAGAVLLTAFVRRQLRSEHPLIDVRMFKVPVFTLTIVIGWSVVLIQYGKLTFLPLELQTLRGMTPLDVGFLFLPAAAASALAFPVAGRLTDRIGPRIPVMTGAAFLAISAWILGHLSTTTPLSTVLTALVAQGLGTGLMMMPTVVTGMNALPARFVAQASAVRSINRRVAASLGVAILATIVTARLGSVSAAGIDPSQFPTAQAAYNSVFLVAFGGAVLAFVLAWFLPDRRANRALHDARAAEQEAGDLAVEAA